ncbi:MAG: hypothetical protein H6719_06650 [Sandaracinaceae bacterium]|nr:hypothetical protein [Sandaracinaceae bacterium]
MSRWIWGIVAAGLLAGCYGSTSEGGDGGVEDDGGGGTICDCCGTRVSWSGSCGTGACDPYCGFVPVDGGVDAGPIEADAGPTDAGPTDAGPASPGCPDSVPAEGEACEGSGTCHYMVCDTVGVAHASCRSGAWSLTTRPCTEVFCRESTCAIGEYCVHTLGGSVRSICHPAPTGPLSCQSVCGGPCDGFGIIPSNPPEVFACNGCSDPAGCP